MKVKTGTRLIRDELSRRTGFAVNDLGYGKLRILSPRPRPRPRRAPPLKRPAAPLNAQQRSSSAAPANSAGIPPCGKSP